MSWTRGVATFHPYRLRLWCTHAIIRPALPPTVILHAIIRPAQAYAVGCRRPKHMIISQDTRIRSTTRSAFPLSAHADLKHIERARQRDLNELRTFRLAQVCAHMLDGCGLCCTCAHTQPWIRYLSAFCVVPMDTIRKVTCVDPLHERLLRGAYGQITLLQLGRASPNVAAVATCIVHAALGQLKTETVKRIISALYVYASAPSPRSECMRYNRCIVSCCAGCR